MCECVRMSTGAYGNQKHQVPWGWHSRCLGAAQGNVGDEN